MCARPLESASGAGTELKTSARPPPARRGRHAAHSRTIETNHTLPSAPLPNTPKREEGGTLRRTKTNTRLPPSSPGRRAPAAGGGPKDRRDGGVAGACCLLCAAASRRRPRRVSSRKLANSSSAPAPLTPPPLSAPPIASRDILLSAPRSWRPCTQRRRRSRSRQEARLDWQPPAARRRPPSAARRRVKRSSEAISYVRAPHAPHAGSRQALGACQEALAALRAARPSCGNAAAKGARTPSRCFVYASGSCQGPRRRRDCGCGGVRTLRPQSGRLPPCAAAGMRRRACRLRTSLPRNRAEQVSWRRC